MNVNSSKAYHYESLLPELPTEEETAEALWKKAGTNAETQKKINELRQKNYEQMEKKRAEREEERRKEYERALKKARKKAMDNQRMLKKEELTVLYTRMAEKRREYSRYLNESSLQREGELDDAKRPRSMNVRAVKSYEKSFLLDVRQQMNML